MATVGKFFGRHIYLSNTYVYTYMLEIYTRVVAVDPLQQY